MSLKTSFFNKTVIKKNVTSFWPVSVFYGIILAIVYPWMYYIRRNLEYNESINTKELAGDVISEGVYTNTFLIVFFSILLAVLVFGYLFKSRNANMMHAFPVTRTELFVSNYAAAFILMIVPNIIVMALFGFMLFKDGCSAFIIYLFASLLINVLQFIFFFGIACAVVMLTGQGVVAVIFYYIVQFVYAVCYLLIFALENIFLYGLSMCEPRFVDSPLFFMSYIVRHVDISYDVDERIMSMNGLYVVALYALAGIIITGLAWYMYQKRHIEKSGDFIIFNWFKYVFKYGAALVLGILIAIAVVSLMTYSAMSIAVNAKSFVLFLIVVAICVAIIYISVEMLIRKSFRVFNQKMFIQCAGCIVVCYAVISLVKADAFGVESYVPDAEDVEYVTVNGEAEYNNVFDTEEEIKSIVDMHEKVIDNIDTIKREHVNVTYNCIYQFITIEYTLKNGKEVKRDYTFTCNEDVKDEIRPLYEQFEMLCYNNAESKIKGIFGRDYATKEFEVKDCSLEYQVKKKDVFDWDSVSISLNKEMASKLVNAVIEDIRNSNLLITRAKMEDEDYYYTMVDTVEEFAKYGALSMEVNGQGCYFNLSEKCKAVFKVLAELNVIESVDNPVVIGNSNDRE